MKRLMKRRIQRIAKDVREWAERVHSLYRDDLKWWSGLGGMCGICSYYLFKRLKDAGFNATFCENEHHAFVKVDDYVVDVTATQFKEGYKKVHIGTIDFCHWRVTRKPLRTEKSVRKRFEKLWPTNQNPIILKRIKGEYHA